MTRGRTVALLVAAAAGWSCGPYKTKPNEEFLERLNAWMKNSTVTRATDKQIVAKPTPSPSATAAVGEGEPIWIQTGKARVITLPRPIKRVSLSDPEMAGIVVLGPRTIMVNAKGLPKTSQSDAGMGMGGGASFIPTSIRARTLTPEPQVSETTLAIWYGSNERPDVHTVFVADFIGQQVMLEVTVAEINRTSMEDHGIDFRKIGSSFVTAYFMGGGFSPQVPGTLSTFPAQQNQPLLPLSLQQDRPQYIFNLPKEDITAFINFLQVEGLASILAQPKIMAMSGQNALFQVGGEIPIRIVTSFVADVEFKPFGTIVNFVPRVSEEGDIMLTVTPEVSAPDFNNTVEGVPTFRTRRASTSARLRNGETLVIGGLLQTARREVVRGIPYLMNLPLVGYVFRDTHYEDEKQELVVVVTPYIVEPLPPDTQLALPTDRGPFQKGEIYTQPEDAEVTRPRIPEILEP